MHARTQLLPAPGREQYVEEVTGVPAAVRCDAVLVVGGRPVGIAEEHITREFAESLAG